MTHLIPPQPGDGVRCADEITRQAAVPDNTQQILESVKPPVKTTLRTLTWEGMKCLCTDGVTTDRMQAIIT